MDELFDGVLHRGREVELLAFEWCESHAQVQIVFVLAGHKSSLQKTRLEAESARLRQAAAAEAEGKRARLTRIDGVSAGSALAFSEHLRVVWLTPDLDGLFRGAAGDRRRLNFPKRPRWTCTICSPSKK
jgi:recombinational DNA repair ATPase RecF